jgi:gas vesicle protein
MSPLLLGAVLGAAGAFLLDPELGRRRRAVIRDKVTRSVTEGRDFADAATQDLQHRARGLRARVSRLRRHRGSSDDLLMERVRSSDATARIPAPSK